MNTAIYQPDRQQTDRLGIMIFLAAALHGIIILGVGFAPIILQTKTPPSLEVILVDKRSQLTPDEAEYLAQVSQDGGGETDDYTRPSSPFVSSLDLGTDGVAPLPLEPGAPELTEQSPDQVLTTLFSDQLTPETPEKEAIEEETVNKAEIQIDQRMEIARLTAELEAQLEEQAKRPRKTFLTARTRESASAEYMHHWVERVERMGNLNYPDDARRQKLYGTLILVVGIRKNGTIEEIVVRRSSGHKLLDDAAKRIVALSAPFEPLSGKLAEETDILYITRTWEFKSNNSITSRD
ncbi:MAG: energy transducer TonB [Gammaproteobacteria bacterium]|nr:energy transducer TonB [Gammaproteobacteria bacterium]